MIIFRVFLTCGSILIPHPLSHLLNFFLSRLRSGAVNMFFFPREMYQVARGVDACTRYILHRTTHQIVSLPAYCAPHITITTNIST